VFILLIIHYNRFEERQRRKKIKAELERQKEIEDKK
jgi:hypothetical protein